MLSPTHSAMRFSVALRSISTRFSLRSKPAGRCSIHSWRISNGDFMAVIRDVMPAFDLLQPGSIAEAQQLLEQHGPDAWVMAGGLDSFDWLKDRIKKPKVVIDLSGIGELRGIRASGNDGSDGIEIGAMTTLTELVNHPIIRQ